VNRSNTGPASQQRVSTVRSALIDQYLHHPHLFLRCTCALLDWLSHRLNYSLTHSQTDDIVVLLLYLTERPLIDFYYTLTVRLFYLLIIDIYYLILSVIHSHSMSCTLFDHHSHTRYNHNSSIHTPSQLLTALFTPLLTSLFTSLLRITRTPKAPHHHGILVQEPVTPPSPSEGHVAVQWTSALPLHGGAAGPRILYIPDHKVIYYFCMFVFFFLFYQPAYLSLSLPPLILFNSSRPHLHPLLNFSSYPSSHPHPILFISYHKCSSASACMP
jgi:hypothetical protein